MQKVIKITYEGMMILLVMLTIMTIWTDNTFHSTINWIVWAVFTVDFLSRLIMTKDKWKFIKNHPFLLLAIVPFDQIFQVARVVRVIYLFRIKTITKYYVTPFIEKLSYKSATVVLSSIMIILIIKSWVMMYLEASVETFWDGLYVTFGHLLFFGREIYVISHPVSIWFLTIASVLGIILQGLALQWAFSKVERYYKVFKNNRINSESK
ncbi:transporter [Oceanobacillus salinisoli]|uniref:transporter n=1 Tax=Oceanobacillus salinisoli TaxID=2678611 RepID=UPI0012E17F71|nr:transporter [Oceanobacillus salinisoli]